MVELVKETVTRYRNPKTHWWYKNETGRKIVHRGHGLPAYFNPYGYSFYHHNRLHRFNGPSSISINSSVSDAWTIRGRYIMQWDYFDWLENNGIDINNISPEEELLILLHWGDNG